MKRIAHPFASEVELCDAFTKWASPQGWVSYAETAGFDILLVYGDGTQIGVHAKMRFNVDVLSQIVPQRHEWQDSGPDFRAVLIPGNGDADLCSALGVTLFKYQAHYDQFSPSFESRYIDWSYLSPKARCSLPSYVPDVPAGASAPVQLTEWKIAALGIAATLELRGYVTREDFRYYGIDHRRWVQQWLVPAETTGRYVASGSLPDFASQHVIVYPQVRTKAAERLAAIAELLTA